MAYAARRSPRLRRSPVAHPARIAGALCVGLAAISLLLPWRPTYDPWAWLVFGREVFDPHVHFSTLAHTGWKPLAVLFTTVFGLFGSAAPLLWLLVPRVAGLAALLLAYRLAWRAGGVAAGLIAALALAFSADWLRYLAAGNIEPLAAALLLAAVELHLRGRWAWALWLGVLVGLARPEIWPLVGVYGLWLWVSERRPWPVILGVTTMMGLWIVPDWAGSGEFLHTFHSATVSGEPTQILHTSVPAGTLTGRALGILVAPVWIAALAGVVYGWRTRERTVLALTVAAGSWFVVTIGGEAIGYPAVPRYLVEPAAVCCVLAGIGFVAVAMRVPAGRLRIAAIVLLVAAGAPFVVARSIGLGHQVSAANQRADDLTDLWRSVDRAKPKAPLASLRPLIAPNKNATALAWKLHVKLNAIAEKADRRAGVVFAEGNPPALAQLRGLGARLTPLSSAGNWRVLKVDWP
jgi:hypothetical protein